MIPDFTTQVTDELKFRKFMAACAAMTSKPVVYAELARTADKKEIDLLLERNGKLYPIEAKKAAEPGRGDVKNFGAIRPVDSDPVPAELAALKREIGMGAVVCMSSDAYPISENAWAFPVWAV